MCFFIHFYFLTLEYVSCFTLSQTTELNHDRTKLESDKDKKDIFDSNMIEKFELKWQVSVKRLAVNDQNFTVLFIPELALNSSITGLINLKLFAIILSMLLKLLLQFASWHENETLIITDDVWKSSTILNDKV